MFSLSQIENAYKLLKRNYYHESYNLFLRNKIAQFEHENFKEKIEKIFDLLKSENKIKLQEWVNKINFHILPKKICNESKSSSFISNVKEFDEYDVDSINYFIDLPIELQIIDVLWCLTCGALLDKKLTKDCYANKINKKLVIEFNKENEVNSDLFCRYIDQYNSWRDNAINKALKCVKDDKDDILIVSMDLRKYYYSIDLNHEDLLSVLKDSFFDNELIKRRCVFLSYYLKVTHEKYREVLAGFLKLSHPECESNRFIPIGLMSSGILANWFLMKFDENLNNNLRPDYYGRYVDDIIILIRRPKIFKSNLREIVEYYFSEIFDIVDDDYFLKEYDKKIKVQSEKLTFQYYDSSHSVAGLELFKKEIEERSSAFKFLPDEHIFSSLEKFAYDVLYNGSVNKFRSIVGLCENDIELIRYLSSHIMLQRLSKSDKSIEVIPDLKKFFKGLNIFRFHKQWERVYQYAVIVGNLNFTKDFYFRIMVEIKKVSYNKSKEIEGKIKRDLYLYNNIALKTTLALLGETNINQIIHYISYDGLDINDIKIYRTSNMIRHHLVSWPLLNYCNFDGDLIDESQYFKLDSIKLDPLKVKFTPRFIHLDEWQLLKFKDNILALEKDNSSGGVVLWNKMKQDVIDYKEIKKIKNLSVNLFSEEIKYDSSTYKSSCIVGESERDKIKVALANFRLKNEDVVNSIRKDSKVNISVERQSELYKILNLVNSENADMLIMPEVSVPVSWLPFMSAYSRRNQIALIFGLEHLVLGDNAYNFIFEILPFKERKIFKSTVVIPRLKNHYSPSEKLLIKNLRLKVPEILVKSKQKYAYHKCKWRGVSFASYNCFELADISHRILFKSEVDLLIACVYNKDINYFKSILESAVRDIHCYVAQSNTSLYGGSCVLQPTSSISMEKIYVKGGENNTILTTTLDIKVLRKFQYQTFPLENDIFKPLPPGYENNKIFER
jgi:hypothetical protein